MTINNNGRLVFTIQSSTSKSVEKTSFTDLFPLGKVILIATCVLIIVILCIILVRKAKNKNNSNRDVEATDVSSSTTTSDSSDTSSSDETSDETTDTFSTTRTKSFANSRKSSNKTKSSYDNRVENTTKRKHGRFHLNLSRLQVFRSFTRDTSKVSSSSKPSTSTREITSEESKSSNMEDIQNKELKKFYRKKYDINEYLPKEYFSFDDFDEEENLEQNVSNQYSYSFKISKSGVEEENNVGRVNLKNKVTSVSNDSNAFELIKLQENILKCVSFNNKTSTSNVDLECKEVENCMEGKQIGALAIIENNTNNENNIQKKLNELSIFDQDENINNDFMKLKLKVTEAKNAVKIDNFVEVESYKLKIADNLVESTKNLKEKTFDDQLTEPKNFDKIAIENMREESASITDNLKAIKKSDDIQVVRTTIKENTTTVGDNTKTNLICADAKLIENDEQNVQDIGSNELSPNMKNNNNLLQSNENSLVYQLQSQCRKHNKIQKLSSWLKYVNS